MLKPHCFPGGANVLSPFRLECAQPWKEWIQDMELFIENCKWHFIYSEIPFPRYFFLIKNLLRIEKLDVINNVKSCAGDPQRMLESDNYVPEMQAIPFSQKSFLEEL